MHVIRLLLLLTTARAAKVAPLPPATAKRFLVVGQPRAGSTWLTKYSPLLARCPGVVTTGEALHPLTVERLAPQPIHLLVLQADALDEVGQLAVMQPLHHPRRLELLGQLGDLLLKCRDAIR